MTHFPCRMGCKDKEQLWRDVDKSFANMKSSVTFWILNSWYLIMTYKSLGEHYKEVRGGGNRHGPGAWAGSPSRPGLGALTCRQQESGWLLPLKGRRMQTACLPSCLLNKYHGEHQPAPSPICAQHLGYVALCPVHFLSGTPSSLSTTWTPAHTGDLGALLDLLQDSTLPLLSYTHPFIFGIPTAPGMGLLSPA